MYVSVTGVALRGAWQAPLFWWHAVRAMVHAQHVAGNLSAAANTVDGVHHTLSSWTDRAAMLAYLRSGAHLGAMKTNQRYRWAKVVGFEADVLPSWPDAIDRLRRDGRSILTGDA